MYAFLISVIIVLLISPIFFSFYNLTASRDKLRKTTLIVNFSIAAVFIGIFLLNTVASYMNNNDANYSSEGGRLFKSIRYESSEDGYNLFEKSYVIDSATIAVPDTIQIPAITKFYPYVIIYTENDSSKDYNVDNTTKIDGRTLSVYDRAVKIIPDPYVFTLNTSVVVYLIFFLFNSGMFIAVLSQKC